MLGVDEKLNIFLNIYAKSKTTLFISSFGIEEILDSLSVNHNHFLLALGRGHSPSSLRESHIEIPDVSWEDIGGLDDVKRGLQEMVRYPVSNNS